MKRLLTALAIFGLTGVVSVYAATIAYSDIGGVGNQAFGGNLALDFTVIAPISVTSLGAFNASGTGTINGTIRVAIFNSSGTEVAGPAVFHGPSTLVGFDVFQTITPVILLPGSYEVDAVGFSAADPNGNLNVPVPSTPGPTLNTGGGLLTFTGASYDAATILDDPTTCAGCQGAPTPQNQQFDAGTFMFNAVNAPEPGTFALFGFGIIALSAVLRRRLAR